MDEHELKVRLISAVLANTSATPQGHLNVNLTVAMEMLDKLLIEYQIANIKTPRRGH